LAGELGIPLFLVRLDSLITKFMGETAAKLRQVFDAIADLRGVYFFDEFDAIGSQRGDGQRRGRDSPRAEQLSADDRAGPVEQPDHCCNQPPGILDYALFRRFDDVVEYHLPTPAQALDLIRSRLGAFAPKPFKKDGLAGQAEG
jgi:AAA+ superfamily predicted ATPase